MKILSRHLLHNLKLFLVIGIMFNAQYLYAQDTETKPDVDEVGEVNKNTSKLQVGVDFDQQDPFVNEIYQKGNYLIYDCVGKYWVCTGKTEYNICKRNRKNAKAEFEKNIRCGYFAEFDSREACYKEQQKMTHYGDIARFCQHPLERKRTKNF